MSDPTTSLRTLIQARIDELGISMRQAARRSDKVSYELLAMIVRGEGSARNRPKTLEGIAEALGVPLAKVYEAAGTAMPEPWEWPERFNVLTTRQRRIVESVAAGYAEANEAARRNGDDGKILP